MADLGVSTWAGKSRVEKHIYARPQKSGMVYEIRVCAEIDGTRKDWTARESDIEKARKRRDEFLDLRKRFNAEKKLPRKSLISAKGWGWV